MKKIAEKLSLVSGAHAIGYLTLTLDKLVLAYLFLIRRMEDPSKSLLEILSQVQVSSVAGLISDPGAEREFLVVTGFTCITIIDLLTTMILVVSINRKVWQGLIPWLVFRGLVAFALLVMSICIATHVLKSKPPTDKGDTTHELLSIGGAHFCLTWSVVLGLTWGAIFRHLQKTINDKLATSSGSSDDLFEETTSFDGGVMNPDTTICTILEEDESVTDDDEIPSDGKQTDKETVWTTNASLRSKEDQMQPNPFNNQRKLRTFSSFN